ncbi:hypothetical protein K491DRAFT_254826 [Lophiostoma macrostomum CBS 122681]|uniref:Rhodopsin domain-containing protein n=1 Tax=Lophiostoma macrostomum CBS 122681 TaxID=1314788 RepID=A0A6A6SK58_9PLEO|nr:hypothetical protein K491DRAFT_254826 [Lophiostoma macrostomum CBS 122681]
MPNNLTVEELEQTEWRIRHSGHVSMHNFEIILAVFFALAAITCAGRVALRLCTRRRLYMDDGLLLASFVCLAVSTGLAYTYMYPWYLAFAWMRGDDAASLIVAQDTTVVARALKNNEVYLGFTWTSIYAVKACYLAFFKPLIAASSRRVICYYWSLITLTAISYLFTTIGESIFPCTFDGRAVASTGSGQMPPPDRRLGIVYWVYSIADALTDTMIVTVPILLLRKSSLPLRTKICLCLFLCLSTFMFACAIIRASYTWYEGSIDFPWQLFWRHIEACVAVIMASVTAYRILAVEIQSRARRSREAHVERYSVKARPEANEHMGSALRAIQFPRPILTGLRSMLRTPSPGTNQDDTVQTGDFEKDFEKAQFRVEYHEHILKTSSNDRMPLVPG